MTCICGIVDKNEVYIGGDSAGVAGLSITIRADEKVFINGPFIMGFTSSFRMGQILRYSFTPPEQKEGVSDMQYMVTSFISSVRESFKNHGFGEIAPGTDNSGGTFLVGYKGNLYNIAGDFQVGIPMNGYDAVGCGYDIALGSLYSTMGESPKKRIELALKAASTHSAGVAPPFVMMKLSTSSVKYSKAVHNIIRL